LRDQIGGERSAVELTDDERDTLLLALHELRITRADHPEDAERIDAVVVRLGSDPHAQIKTAGSGATTANTVPRS
jgi:hypothetical protein